MICQDDIINKLVTIYHNYENWQINLMPYQTAYDYHKKLYESGNIQVYEIDGEIIGYYEVWRITFEQFGRLICQERFCADTEDVQIGKIAYVANVWIQKEHRQGKVFNDLMKRFFRLNYHCEYFVGEALRKKTAPIKVFKKSELVSKLFKEGV